MIVIARARRSTIGVRPSRTVRGVAETASTSSLEPLKGAAEVYYLCRKHGRYRVVKRRAFITLLGGAAARRRGGVGGEPQLEAEILVLRQPHLM